MGVYAEIESDAALRVALGWFDTYPNYILIDTRTFVQIPNAHYDNGNITLNEVEYKVSDHYKAFYRDEVETWIMLGEATDNYGDPKSGSRNYIRNPIGKEELLKVRALYDDSKFHIDFPRVEEVI